MLWRFNVEVVEFVTIDESDTHFFFLRGVNQHSFHEKRFLGDNLVPLLARADHKVSGVTSVRRTLLMRWRF